MHAPSTLKKPKFRDIIIKNFKRLKAGDPSQHEALNNCAGHLGTQEADSGKDSQDSVNAHDFVISLKRLCQTHLPVS